MQNNHLSPKQLNLYAVFSRVEPTGKPGVYAFIRLGVYAPYNYAPRYRILNVVCYKCLVKVIRQRGISFRVQSIIKLIFYIIIVA